MKTTIRSGNYEVVESGIFYMDNPESEVIMHLVIENVSVGDIKIHFLTIQHMQSPQIEAEIEDGVLVLKCINFNSSFGTGSTTPMDIGYAEGKKIFLHIHSYLFEALDTDQGSMTRKVEYSVLREI